MDVRAKTAWRYAIGASLFTFVAACATSPRADIKDSMMRIGFHKDHSICFANALNERLDRERLRKVADLVEAAERREDFLAAAAQASDLRIAGAIAAASAACIAGD